MFLPIGDTPNPPSRAYVTWGLIAINVLVFLLVTLPLNRGLTQQDLSDPAFRETLQELWDVTYEAAQASRLPLREGDWLQSLRVYDVFVFRWGYKPGQPSWVTLLFAMFLHGGLLHLAGNMLYLWIFGDNVEDRLGSLGFLAAYLATGVAATLVFAQFDRTSMIPMVGASGAISGVLGFYLIWFPRNSVKIFIWLGIFFADVVLIPAVWVLLFYVVVQNLFPVLQGREGGVAYGAHLGGFGAGVLLALVLGRLQGKRLRPVRVDATRSRSVVEGIRNRLTAAEEFHVAMDRGHHHAALRSLGQILHGGGTLPRSREVFDLGAWLLSTQRLHDAQTVLRFYIGHYPRGPELAGAHLGLGRVARSTGREAAAREHFLTVIDLAGQNSALGQQALAALHDPDS